MRFRRPPEDTRWSRRASGSCLARGRPRRGMMSLSGASLGGPSLLLVEFARSNIFSSMSAQPVGRLGQSSLQFWLVLSPSISWLGGRLDRNEQGVAWSCGGTTSARGAGARRLERLQLLLCECGLGLDALSYGACCRHSLQALVDVLSSDRGAGAPRRTRTEALPFAGIVRLRRRPCRNLCAAASSPDPDFCWLLLS